MGDGSVKKVWINEAVNLKSVVDNLKAPPEGLWLGGKKYRITRTDAAEESGDCSMTWIQANFTKHGVHIIKTSGKQIVCGFYSEEKGQSSGNCKNAVVALAVYLM